MGFGLRHPAPTRAWKARSTPSTGRAPRASLSPAGGAASHPLTYSIRPILSSWRTNGQLPRRAHNRRSDKIGDLIESGQVRTLILLLSVAQLATGFDSTDPREFFEMRVRPVLARNCFSCHTQTRMGGLE